MEVSRGLNGTNRKLSSRSTIWEWSQSGQSSTRTPVTGGAPFRGGWVPEKSAFATRMHASKKWNAAPPEFSGTQPPLEAQENLQKPKKKGNQYKIKEKQRKYIQKQLEKRECPGGDKRRTSGEQGHEQSTAPLSSLIVFVCISFVFL